MAEEPYADARYISVETFRRNGRGVKTPVWCAPCGNEIAVFTERKAGKVKRLRNNDRIRVARCDMRGKVHGDWVEGTARIVDSKREEDHAYAALREKYGWLMMVTDLLSTLSGRIRGRAVLMLRLDDA
ncbi:MAG: PPOX class F420-dependent oxidoreductase [Myxococcota bacterium]|jgi:hypothetical protein|nr:PPOX class F420-dependent oxidoreductase [Myxococcota bacterium]